MTSVDKAAIGWSIAIVAIGVAIAGAGMSGVSFDTGSPAAPAPMMQEKTSGDPFADIAKETMSKAEEREQAMAEQKSGTMQEKSSGVTVSAPKVTEPPKMTAPKTARVSMPTGTSVPGCEETNACFIPASVSVATGGIVTWSNDDTAAHTVTSGSPTEGPDGVFDSSLVMGGSTFQYTFNKAGVYDYFCMVHPWMTGTVNVS
ncbi:MAG: plastocyanin/azurin family copper-binding protein [Nitrosopumilaceae archaeon]